MYVKQETIDLINKTEKELQEQFDYVNEVCEYNTMKVMQAFHNNALSEVHFGQTTGYGYNDIGRETIENIYCEIFGAESALVRGQFISASHALNVTFFGLLRPNDTMISISGQPYDTMEEVIGIVDNPSSLKSFGVKYEQIDLIDNDFDYEKIKERLSENNVKLVEIQRSRGYALRKSLTLDKIEKVIKTIRSVNQDVIIMVDNCYGEFTNKVEPTHLGADVVVGSLIKNLGGGIAPNGAYVVGKKDLIKLVAERLTLPGEGAEVGPTLGMNKMILQGLFFAPSVVAGSLKTAILTAKVMQDLGYTVDPKWDEKRTDIVQTVNLNDREKLIRYVQGVQKGSPVDSTTLPIPDDMPGYTDQIIMAAGAFTQGSSIEFSCDAPIRPPFTAFQQGGLTYESGKIGVMKAVENLLSE